MEWGQPSTVTQFYILFSNTVTSKSWTCAFHDFELQRGKRRLHRDLGGEGESVGFGVVI